MAAELPENAAIEPWRHVIEDVFQNDLSTSPHHTCGSNVEFLIGQSDFHIRRADLCNSSAVRCSRVLIYANLRINLRALRFLWIVLILQFL